MIFLSNAAKISQFLLLKIQVSGKCMRTGKIIVACKRHPEPEFFRLLGVEISMKKRIIVGSHNFHPGTLYGPDSTNFDLVVRRL